MTWTALLIIVVVLGVIVSNVMLLKHSAKMSMKNINRDPIEDAKQRLAERKTSMSNDRVEEVDGSNDAIESSDAVDTDDTFDTFDTEKKQNKDD